MDRKNTGTKRLKTDNLVLRKIIPTDFFCAVRWYRKAELARFAISRKPFTLKDTRRLTITKILHYNKNVFCWAIVKSGKMIGLVELKPMNDKLQYNLHYKIDFRYRGKGYATEAVRAVLEYSKTQEISTVFAHCDVDNKASARVLEKSVMTRFTPKGNTEINYENGESAQAIFYKFDTKEQEYGS